MRHLLLGGAGFIGRELASALVQAKHDVFVGDSFANSARIVEELPYEWSYLDVRNSGHLESALSSYNPDYVLWMVSPGEALEKNFYEMFLQIQALANLLHIISKKRDKQPTVVLFSTADVYKPAPELITEESPLYWGTLRFSPAAPAIMREWVLFSLCKHLAVDYIVLRLSNVVGFRETDDSLVRLLNGMLVEQSDSWFIEGSKQKRDFIWITDAVRMIKKVLQAKKVREIFNIASGRGISNQELIEVLSQIHTPPKLPKQVETNEADLVLSNKKINELGTTRLTNIFKKLPEVVAYRKKLLEPV